MPSPEFNALMVRANPSFYADPRVAKAAYSYADIFFFNQGAKILRVGGPRDLRNLFEGKDIPIAASMLSTMELGPWGNTTGLGSDKASRSGPWCQPVGDRIAEGEYRAHNPLDRFHDMHGNVWLARPTLVPFRSGATNECNRGYLIGSTISINGHMYTDDEVEGEIRSIAVPILFPEDGLDMKLFRRFDERAGNALSQMVRYRKTQVNTLQMRYNRANKCLEERRKGKRFVTPSLTGGVSEKLSNDWMAMTPRKLSNEVTAMKNRIEKRHETTKKNITDMAQQMSAFSKLMIARLPIAYCVLLRQINDLTYGEKP